MAPSKGHDYSDNRAPWDWKSKYPPEARKLINNEAYVLAGILVVVTIVAGATLCLSGSSINVPLGAAAEGPAVSLEPRVLAVFFCGNVGGTTFSIKWLIHSAAKGGWHLDRTYWRFFVPLIGGVYACVVLTLFESGLLGGRGVSTTGMANTAALAFLIGYFSDGVSGLLTNIANAVFGTLREK